MNETTPTQVRIEKIQKQIEERTAKHVALNQAIGALKVKERMHKHELLSNSSIVIGTFCGEDFEVPKELLPMALALVEACAMHWEQKGQGKSPDNHDSVAICVKPPPGMVDVDVSLRVPEDTAKALREGKIGGFSMASRIDDPKTLTVKVKDLKPGDVLTSLGHITVVSVGMSALDRHCNVETIREPNGISFGNVMPANLELTIRRKESSDAK